MPGILGLKDGKRACSIYSQSFPPVMIDVEYGGEIFDEMHVDGSVFSSTVGIELIQGEILDLMTADRNLYYVINWPITSVFQPVKPRITHIGFHTFATMLKNQHRWDLFRCSIASDLAAGSISDQINRSPLRIKATSKRGFTAFVNKDHSTQNELKPVVFYHE